jgi:hypothetical protein
MSCRHRFLLVGSADASWPRSAMFEAVPLYLREMLKNCAQAI